MQVTTRMLIIILSITIAWGSFLTLFLLTERGPLAARCRLGAVVTALITVWAVAQLAAEIAL